MMHRPGRGNTGERQKEMGQVTHGTCFANKSKYQILPHLSTWLPKYSNNLATTPYFPGLLSRVMNR